MARSVYARIADLRAAGLTDTSQYPDSTLLGLLELASELVEVLTSQFFGPKHLVLTVNGLGKFSAAEPQHNKIIEFNSLTVTSRDGTPYVVDPTDYTVHERFVRLRRTDTGSSPYDRAFRAFREYKFPYDDLNVVLDGVFGWLDPEDKHETTLSAALAKNDQTVYLNDIGDVETDDLLLIDDRFWVVAGAVSTPGSSVSIDPAPKAAAVDATVVRYGKVPRLLREAVVRTAIARRYLPGSEDEAGAQYDQRIRREQTDNYEVEFYASPAGDTLVNGTGDPIADALLSRFRAAAVSGIWV